MINTRALIVTVLVLLSFAGLAFKLVDIQIFKSEELSYYAKKQQLGIETIKADRGFIYDRKGVLMVYNRNDISFYVDLRMLNEKKKDELAVLFAKTFGKSINHYSKLLSQSGKTICIEKKSPFEKAVKLMDYNLSAMFFTEDPTRVYHYGRLASHILGYVNSDYIGTNGIARSFDDELNGEDGARLVEKNALGDLTSIPDEGTKAPVPGNDIYLTIDRMYQNILEEELKHGMETYQSASAVGIIMDPNTGEILALANADDYDPNNYSGFSDYQRKDRAITDIYEPGSTFKAFTIAALLEEDACYESETVNVENGVYKFRNAYIRDTHKFQSLTVKKIIEESSNIGISKLVQRLDDETYYKHIRSFGFGTFTSITLPGEVTGNLRKPEEWSKITKAFMSFGYGISVTPIQTVTAFSSLINGGILYKPLVVKKIVSKDGRLIKEFNPVEVRKVISDKTSQRMRNLLTGVVQNGTGKTAQIENFSVGGKTGTSKIVENGKYVNGKYFSSFIGFLPAENPKVVCYIMFSNPKSEYYGGKVAAPVFKNVVEKLIQADPLRFVDDNNQFKDKNDDPEENSEKQLIVDDMQITNPVLNNETTHFTNVNENIMPDLRGKTVKEALLLLKSINIKFSVNGNGIVVDQSILPGTSITKNKTCRLNCSEVSLNGTTVY